LLKGFDDWGQGIHLSIFVWLEPNKIVAGIIWQNLVIYWKEHKKTS
jgi:hypothetical protein